MSTIAKEDRHYKRINWPVWNWTSNFSLVSKKWISKNIPWKYGPVPKVLLGQNCHFIAVETWSKKADFFKRIKDNLIGPKIPVTIKDNEKHSRKNQEANWLRNQSHQPGYW